jgi:hypothetical protein
MRKNVNEKEIAGYARCGQVLLVDSEEMAPAQRYQGMSMTCNMEAMIFCRRCQAQESRGHYVQASRSSPLRRHMAAASDFAPVYSYTAPSVKSLMEL